MILVDYERVLIPLIKITGISIYNKLRLQKVNLCLARYPTWSIAHIAAYCELAEAFRDDKIIK